MSALSLALQSQESRNSQLSISSVPPKFEGFPKFSRVLYLYCNLYRYVGACTRYGYSSYRHIYQASVKMEHIPWLATLYCFQQYGGINWKIRCKIGRFGASKELWLQVYGTVYCSTFWIFWPRNLATFRATIFVRIRLNIMRSWDAQDFLPSV